ncbi:MAG: class I SAM-dependent methyltransferase [Pseudomonadota bacterium]
MDAVSPWVARFAGWIGEGEVLDLACGGGRHARHLAALGHPVTALDRDPQALRLAAGPGITTVQADLEAPGAVWPFAQPRFQGIVVTNYLHRPLMAQLIASMLPDAVLIYETFARGNEQFGKPSNPAFLLEPGQLLAIAQEAGLQVLAFEEGVIDQPKPAMVQRLCAAGRAFARTNACLTAV